jgi:NADH-quinone oxidoreductase subunit K/NAD(P)H-quinone oxidoreductase subunit 4L
MVPLEGYLAVAAALFAIGVYTVLAQRGAVMVLMGLELILNAAGLNIVAFWRFVQPGDYSAQVFLIVVVTVATIEMALGLALMMLIHRNRRTVQVDRFEALKG